MLQPVDVLAALRSGAQTLDSLLSVLPGADPKQLRAMLDELVARDWVGAGAAGFGGDISGHDTMWVLRPAGEAAYGGILDRYAAELMGPPTMSVSERFLVALAEEYPAGAVDSRERLARLAAHPSLARRDESAERRSATALARRAIGVWALAALRSEESAQTAAAGLASLPVTDFDDIEYAAARLRTDYAPALREGELRTAVGSAARAGLMLYEARPVTKVGDIWHDRQTDPAVLYEVADQAATTLAALGRAGVLDPVSEAAATVGLPTNRNNQPSE